MKIKGKDEIRDAALDIIAYDGIENLTMSTLAKNLGLTKAALYHWYTSKEEILDDIYSEGHRRLMKKGFKLSLKGNIEDVLMEAASKWEELFSDQEIMTYLRCVFSLHFCNEMARDEYRALSLMLKSQVDVIIDSIPNERIQKNKAIISKLFSSLLISNLETMLDEEESNMKNDVIDFSKLLQTL